LFLTLLHKNETGTVSRFVMKSIIIFWLLRETVHTVHVSGDPTVETESTKMAILLELEQPQVKCHFGCLKVF
jgi:hypothetical protein